jgi:glycerol-3-phosphate dehydrogenase
VEQSDLGSATSSASTRLIHGGLRYLESGEFRLVHAALQERERLLAIAPHIIRPMQFVLPHVPGLRPRWMIRLGLFFYDHAGGRRSLPASRGVRLAGTELGSGLDPPIRRGFVYSDCWVDDSRLVILNAMDAAERGARILPGTRLVSARCREGIWSAVCQERGGRRRTIRARAIVNAAGPWVDGVQRSLLGDRLQGLRIRLVKGSHIVVPRLYRGNHAFTLQHPDARVVFAIPYEEDYTAIGTTEVDFTGDPGAAAISPPEEAYLCDTIRRYFPHRGLSPSDVVWSFAGVRPLVDDDSSDLSKVTRDYRLDLQAAGRGFVLAVYGGKITTYRRLAEGALDRLRPHLGGGAHSWTGRAPLPGGDLPARDPAAFLEDCVRRWPELPRTLVRRLARSYGTRIEVILAHAKTLGDLGEEHGAGLTDAEVEYLRTREWADSADAILWRRTKLGLHMTAAQREAFAGNFRTNLSPGFAAQ